MADDSASEGIQWRELWTQLGQPWRTEPEIPRVRQEELLERLRVVPDSVSGLYPFRGHRLTRADLEWLLQTPERKPPETEYGPEVPPAIEIHEPGAGLNLGHLFGRHDTDEEHDYSWVGFAEERWHALDLRGADLSRQNLSNLPLDHVRAGLWEGQPGQSQRWDVDMLSAASARFDGCDLSGASLVGAVLVGARLEGVRAVSTSFRTADVRYAHLQGAVFFDCGFERANLSQANLSGVVARRCRFALARMGGASCKQAEFPESYFEGTDFAHSYNGMVSRVTPRR